MPSGQHLRLRCFLEGIEVPIISASLSIQPDTPAQCNIQIPATDKALEFLPRTLIHVFFWDYHGGPGDTSLITVAEPDGVTTSDERAREQVRRMLEDQESSFEDDPALGVNLDRPQQTQQYSSSGTDPATATRVGQMRRRCAVRIRSSLRWTRTTCSPTADGSSSSPER
jgi:hypothetical protein